MNDPIHSILVIDDVEENRMILERRLSKEGYEVATAADGEQALEMLRTSGFDLVLSDIVMPTMDGVSLLDTLQADEKLSSIPVVMLTAVEDADIVLKCLRRGAKGYVTKPFNMHEVTNVIRNCLTPAA